MVQCKLIVGVRSARRAQLEGSPVGKRNRLIAFVARPRSARCARRPDSPESGPILRVLHVARPGSPLAQAGRSVRRNAPRWAPDSACCFCCAPQARWEPRNASSPWKTRGRPSGPASSICCAGGTAHRTRINMWRPPEVSTRPEPWLRQGLSPYHSLRSTPLSPVRKGER
jgi:hypothetical protein